MDVMLRATMGTVKIPTNRDRVYKDECMFSFDTPESLGGLFTSLTTWQSFGSDYLDIDFERQNNPLYLKQVWKRVAIDDFPADIEMKAASGPSRIAIGVEGGFDVDKKKFEKHVTNSLIVMPRRVEVLLPADVVPTQIQLAVDAILKHDGYNRAAQVAMAWEEEDRKESKYARDLVQLNTGIKVSPNPKHWNCEESGMTENLWLNLSTGHIGSGRKMWDGSGGTGAALTHYEETGKLYPLAVKLGTISPQGADVYSYATDEDDMVLDPYLADHLAHWGINMMLQEKTEKTLTEMEVELNAMYQFDRITESGSDLVALHGSGYIGLENLGNSCYMASVMQILFSMSEIEKRYKDRAMSIFKSSKDDPAKDLLVMMAKLGVGLLSDRYAKPITLYEKDALGSGELRPSPSNLSEDYGGVRPFMFKNMIGAGHVDFSSARQQDSSEFFQYFLDKITRAERSDRFRLQEQEDVPFVQTEDLFKFMVEERIEDRQSKKVKYMTRPDNMLSLSIDVNSATNRAQYDEFEEQKKKKLKTDGEDKVESPPVQLQVPLSACIRMFCQSEIIEEFKSPETGTTGSALKRTRLSTFPPYLVVRLKRYYVAEDWTPKKLDAAVPMPDELDLSELKSFGPVPGEVLFKEDARQVEIPELLPNPEIVNQLMAMGFSENGSKRAAVATKNSSAEASMEWVFAHMQDADFNEPMAASSVPNAAKSQDSVQYASGDIASLTAMGFVEKHARAALKATGGSLERAADWLFNHASDLDAAVTSIENDRDHGSPGESNGIAPSKLEDFIDGEPKYELLGFASHLGSNTSCGHYVAHIKKEGRYVLYNDSKVAISQNPPNDLGFLYVYRRKART